MEGMGIGCSCCLFAGLHRAQRSPDVMLTGNLTPDDCSFLTPAGPIIPTQGRGQPLRGRGQVGLFLVAAGMTDNFDY